MSVCSLVAVSSVGPWLGGTGLVSLFFARSNAEG